MFSETLSADSALNKIFLISQRLIIFDGLDDVFSHIVKTAVALTLAEAATIRVFDFTTGKLKIMKGYGVSNGFLSQPPMDIGEGITGRVVLKCQPFVTANLPDEPNCANSEVAKIEGITAFMSIPLRTKDKCIGALNIYRKNDVPFSEQDMLLLNIFGMQAAEAIEKSSLMDDLSKQAAYDHLTYAYNKKTILNVINKNLSLATRHRLDTSVIFIDIDNFKDFNDTHGHILGDKLLCDFIKILKANSRKADSIGRFGGEEFIMLLPHTDKKKALIIANKLKDIIAKRTFIGKSKSRVKMTFSAGIASFPEDGATAEDLIAKADAAMYQSKKAGKNCISVC